MRDQFQQYLERIRLDSATLERILLLVEDHLPSYIRRHFSEGFTTLYDNTNPVVYDEMRSHIFTNHEANAENQAAGGAYSQALKYYSGFLRSKYFSTAKLVSKEVSAKPSPKPSVEKQPLVEGAKVQVRLEKHERNPELRKACIAHYGYVCQVCGLDFTKAYGDLGRDFIEVHHLTPISTTEGEHEVDPVNDLVPLCSNCHSMIHRGENRPLTLDELRAQYIGYKWDEQAE